MYMYTSMIPGKFFSNNNLYVQNIIHIAVKAAEFFHFIPENVQIHAFKHVFIIPRNVQNISKYSQDIVQLRFCTLASKGHNHRQETYSRPILHRGFNFYFHV